jgi:hypothetical protein
MVDPRGRSQQAMSATTNADGSVTVECGQHDRRKRDYRDQSPQRLGTKFAPLQDVSAFSTCP